MQYEIDRLCSDSKLVIYIARPTKCLVDEEHKKRNISKRLPVACMNRGRIHLEMQQLCVAQKSTWKINFPRTPNHTFV